MSGSQEGDGAGTDGLLTLIVKSFIEDTQQKNGHLRQKTRLQSHHCCDLIIVNDGWFEIITEKNKPRPFCLELFNHFPVFF